MVSDMTSSVPSCVLIPDMTLVELASLRALAKNLPVLSPDS